MTAPVGVGVVSRTLEGDGAGGLVAFWIAGRNGGGAAMLPLGAKGPLAGPPIAGRSGGMGVV